MKPTLRILEAAKGRTPLIHFLGPRKTTTAHPAHHPHYLAPPEAKGEAFEAFLKKLGVADTSSATAGKTAESNQPAYQRFWDVPSFGNYRMSELSEAEIELIMSGGSSFK